MMEDGCAFVCAIFCVLAGVLSAFTMATGNWEAMVVVVAFSAVVVVLAGVSLASRYL